MHRLRQTAEKMPHRELAKRLGITRALLQNWLYRDTPKEVVARALIGKLPRIRK